MERQGLRVIDGRLSDQTRRDEARIEALAQLDEVDDFIVTAVPVVREWLGNLVKLGERNRAARAEMLGLGGHSNDAA